LSTAQKSNSHYAPQPYTNQSVLRAYGHENDNAMVIGLLVRWRSAWIVN